MSSDREEIKRQSSSSHDEEIVDEPIAQQQLADLRARLSALDAKSLYRYMIGVRAIRTDLQTTRDALDSRLQFYRIQLPQTLVELRSKADQLRELRTTVVNATTQIESDRYQLLTRMQESAPDLLAQIDQLHVLESALDYMRCMQHVSDLCASISLSLVARDWRVLLAKHCSLVDLSTSMDGTACRRMLDYVHMRVDELNATLISELESALRHVLDAIKYPFEETVELQFYDTLIHEMDAILRCIDSVRPDNDVASSIETKSYIVALMIEPMQTRFRYHFYGSRKTNVLDKPEWFLTLIITWLQNHAQLFDAHLQPIVGDRCAVRIDVQRALVALVIEKINHCADDIITNRLVLSHWIDECIIFEMEMQAMGFSEHTNNVVDQFAARRFLPIWLELERESCTGGVEKLLTSDDRWLHRFREVSDIDHHRVPECADSFITLLQLMTERYRLIGDWSAKIEFLRLQTVLLDDFRLRLVQIGHDLTTPWATPFPQLLNALWYIAYVLEEWNEVPFFIRIQAQNDEKPDRRIRGAFEDMVELYKHGWKQCCSDMIGSLITELRSLLSLYQREKWFAPERRRAVDVTPSFCPFLLALRNRLGSIASSLAPDSLLTVMSMLCTRLAQLLNDNLVAQTSFSASGAAQMQFDIGSSLITLLQSVHVQQSSSVAHIIESDQQMSKLVDSLKLLALPTPTMLLLRETIDKNPDEMLVDVMSEFEIGALDRDSVIQLMKQRCDIIKTF